MTALDELVQGKVGPAFLDLLQRTIRAMALRHRFPPPDRLRAWDATAVNVAVNDFLSSPQTPRRLSDLTTRCRTDDALRKQLQAAVRNHYADQGRRTPVGRLVVRVNEVLSADKSFERNGAHWRRTGSTAEPTSVDEDAVASAVAAVEVVVPTAWSGKRTGPDVDAESVRRMALAAIDAAGGSATAADIARAAAVRLGLGGAPLSIGVAGFEEPSAASASVEDHVVGSQRVEEVFALLNDHERMAIGLAGVPVAKLGPMLGVSGSKAALIRTRAVAILRDELAGEEDGQAVADAVLTRARDWSESWTT